MKCPFCAEENTKVIDSRPTDDSSIRRRRQTIIRFVAVVSVKNVGSVLQLMRSWRQFLLLS